MSTKKMVMVTIILVVALAWVGYNAYRNKKTINEFVRTQQEFNLAISEVSKDISQESLDKEELLRDLRDAKSKALKIQAIVEENTNNTAAIENKQKIADVIKGLDLMEKGTLEQNQSIFMQGVQIIESL